ncbi:hypothetical protein AEAC466_09615 [Asticcacaulis sp. AC466]|uniref:hypothetical protein n=1 Tax=Asticcacaulis sp. AC466 TaxID=1282362 RepID=UPI0003C3D412|nr:hypothetical protein [Asticcacaulis sp. AC466]ESQ83992.1 hypothetical protein AEAC466_09615 [Asticcacaulis sp. AC466]
MKKAVLFVVLTFWTSSAIARETNLDLAGPATISGWVDLRLGHADGEKSWLKGGFGKLRKGGHSANAYLAQAALLWTPRLSDNITAHVLAHYVPDAVNPLGVSEAYFKWKPVPTSPTRYSMRLGRMFPPISLEHDGPGWTTTRTLTPSAINSWVGEELLLDGLEANVQTTVGDHKLGGTFGVYGSDDTAGTILAFRGWALHDIASSGNTKLPLPTGNGTGYSAVFLEQAPYSKPSVEVDGRMGYYGRIDWRPPVPVAFNVIYLYNPGTPTIVKNGQYGWTTRVVGGGLQARISPKDEVLSQVMWGTTKMGGIVDANRHAVDIHFDSAYALVSHSFDDGTKLTARGEYFEVIDHSWVDSDNNNEKGYSGTLAWRKPVGPNLDLAVEAVHIWSLRPARRTQFEAANQTQSQIQLALKFHI